jgi:flagellin-like hook-associated protein FlgL
MTTIHNNASLLNAPRALDATGNAQTKGNAAADASKAHKASSLGGNIFAGEDATTVNPKLYDVLQSIIAESYGVQPDTAIALSSQIKDANSADGVIDLAKAQILNQSGSSALGQNNKEAQAMLSLLK